MTTYFAIVLAALAVFTAGAFATSLKELIKH